MSDWSWRYTWQPLISIMWTLIFSIISLAEFLFDGKAVGYIHRYRRLVLTWFRGDSREFTLFVYEDELTNIREWVSRKEDIETGGDLFGLWIDEHAAVVQLVLGPGQKCKRTPTSFYQDLDYLEQSGAVITKNHGLCNIGQWHSHHRIGLSQPSLGDENTVWGNMPGLRLNRFIVFIATIAGPREQPDINIHPFLFEIDSESGDKLPVLKGTICELQKRSPLRLDGRLQEKLKYGAESWIKENGSTYVEIENMFKH